MMQGCNKRKVEAKRRFCGTAETAVDQAQGCGIKGFFPTSVIQGNPPLYERHSVWEALSVVSQKLIPFPTALKHIFAMLKTCWLIASKDSVTRTKITR